MEAGDLREAALDYHRLPTPGKISVTPTKPLTTQRDLALAYSPGVAAACQAIVDDPIEASAMTARHNLVAVVTNGTAVLGLGAIGPLASKPVCCSAYRQICAATHIRGFEQKPPFRKSTSGS